MSPLAENNIEPFVKMNITPKNPISTPKIFLIDNLSFNVNEDKMAMKRTFVAKINRKGNSLIGVQFLFLKLKLKTWLEKLLQILKNINATIEIINEEL